MSVAPRYGLSGPGPASLGNTPTTEWHKRNRPFLQ